MIAEGLVLTALLGPLIGLPWWDGFRRYFANDQLSYAAIAANVATGDVSLVEPFTLTGSLYYPSLWYQLIGVVAAGTGASVQLIWTILGLLIVSAGVLTVGWLALKISGAALAPVLPALALFTGVLAIPTAGYWYSSLGVHAVLWGPFGTLFTLNAEVAGLSITAIAVSVLVAAPGSRHRLRVAHVLTAALLIGLLANIQTYTFFTAMVLAALFLAIRTLITYPSRQRAILTVALLLGVLIAGAILAGRVSPFAIMGAVLLALAPAVWPLALAHIRLTIGALALLALASAPQLVRTVLGLASGDPFLTYRQASTQDLGVLYPATVIAIVPLLAFVAVCVIALWNRREPTLIALTGSLVAGLVLMSTNDVWGFDQEPYRFWLQFTILACLLLTPVLAWALVQQRDMGRPRRASFFVVLGVAMAVWAVGLADVAGFWRFARDEGIIVTSGERLDAARVLLADAPGIIMSSACLDPQVLKQVTRGPVAYYNKGLAWPADVQAFEIFKDTERRAAQDPVALRAADVTHVVTDSSCPTDWVFPAGQDVVAIGEQSYMIDGRREVLTLWWVAP